MKREQIHFCLVRPGKPANIGAAARALKNMGFRYLALVAPQCSLDEECRRWAYGAHDIVDQAVTFPSLRKAVAQAGLVVGTTGRWRGLPQEIRSPEEIAPLIAAASEESQVYLLFGAEESGLTNEELSYCRLRSRIPTEGEFHSLNLAQAVLVYAYELHKLGVSESGKQRQRKLATQKELQGLWQQLEETLIRIGYLAPQGSQKVWEELKQIVWRLELSSREVKILRGVLRQYGWYEKKSKIVSTKTALDTSNE